MAAHDLDPNDVCSIEIDEADAVVWSSPKACRHPARLVLVRGPGLHDVDWVRVRRRYPHLSHVRNTA
jgi:hypothetical protein